MIDQINKELIFAGITSFAITLLLIPLIIKIAKKKNLLDQPSQRKEHKIPIPTLGGIGIFIGLFTSTILWVSSIQNISIKYLITALSILLITGIRDDIKNLSASKKLLIQISVAFIVVLGGVRIESLFGMFGLYDIPLIVQFLLSIMIITGITNAVNLLDGIDGLAGGIAFINTIIFVILFTSAGAHGYAIIAISLAGAILAFIRYNFSPAKIFMGDTGSLIIGFLLAVFGIQYLNTNAVNSNADSLIMVYGILILPVFDTMRVFVIRIIKGRSPFSPDKNHIHHLLIKTGSNHKKAAIILYTANIILVLSAFILTQFNADPFVSVIVLTGIAIFFSELLTIVRAIQSHIRIKFLISAKKRKQTENYLLASLNQME